MSSLKAQLERLKTPQTSLLLRDKKRASLLFTPTEAANLDRDTVFNIGKPQEYYMSKSISQNIFIYQENVFLRLLLFYILILLTLWF